MGGRSTLWTPLHHAACNGDVRMCKLLLAAGADTDSRIRVPKHGPGEAERLMGMYPKQRTEDFGRPVFGAGSTPLQLAQNLGHTAAVELLQGWPRKAPVRARMWKNRLRPARVLQKENGTTNSILIQENTPFSFWDDQFDSNDDFNLKQQRALMWEQRELQQRRIQQRRTEKLELQQRRIQQRRMKQRRHLSRPQGPRNRWTSRRQTTAPPESPGRLMLLQEVSESEHWRGWNIGQYTAATWPTFRAIQCS